MAAERDISDLTIPDVLSILPLRGTVVFPKAVVPLAAVRPASVRRMQGALADLIAASLPTLPMTLRQGLLETLGVAERLQRLVAALTKEAEVLELGSKIQSEVHSEMSKTQRDYYLREQMKAIQKELGES